MKYPKSYLNLGLLITTLVFMAANAGAWVPLVAVPEASSTYLLLGLSMTGLIAIKRFIKR